MKLWKSLNQIAHKLTGWQRLVVVLSVLWVLCVSAKALNDYYKVSSGGPPRGGFVTLEDGESGRQYGQLSKVGVRQLLNDEWSSTFAAARVRQNNERLVRQMEAQAKENGISVKDAAPVATSASTPVRLEDEFESPVVAAMKRLDTTLHVGDLILAMIVPPVFLCAAFFVAGWVVAGFRKTNNQSTVRRMPD